MYHIRNIHHLRVKIFADGAEKAGILELAKLPHIKGFTTNPTLMRKAGITDYAAFAKDILTHIKDKPISFEVFSDDFAEMERQARIIASWADNVYVKIPITNTRRESSFDVVKRLTRDGIKVNVTAILTIPQIKHIIGAITLDTPAIISVFAGRIADTGVDPVPIMKEAKNIVAGHSNIELLWASPRELYNIYHAEDAGCDIITVTHDILKKIERLGYDHHDLSLDTVKMFYEDGQKVGYTLYDTDSRVVSGLPLKEVASANPYNNPNSTTGIVRDVSGVAQKYEVVPGGAEDREYIDAYLKEIVEIVDKIDRGAINSAIEILRKLRERGGRLFILGVGGGAGHASHAVNDFRKLANIEAYTPVDNVAELTARVNDDGWESVFVKWLEGSSLNDKDAVLVFSVGGGNAEKNISMNIVQALKFAKEVGAKIIGVVGRDGGYTKEVADACILVPVVNPETVTPHTESFQAAIWHLIVSHPGFRVAKGKWESVR